MANFKLVAGLVGSAITAVLSASDVIDYAREIRNERKAKKMLSNKSNSNNNGK